MQVRYQLRHRPKAESSSLLQALVRFGDVNRFELWELNDGGVSPQPLELIEETFFFVKDVHDNFATVQKRPSSEASSLLAERGRSRFGQHSIYFIGDGLDHAFIAPTTHHKHIAKSKVLRDVQGKNLRTESIASRLGRN